jgi:hypothetical protein
MSFYVSIVSKFRVWLDGKGMRVWTGNWQLRKSGWGVVRIPRHRPERNIHEEVLLLGHMTGCPYGSGI